MEMSLSCHATSRRYVVITSCTYTWSPENVKSCHIYHNHITSFQVITWQQRDTRTLKLWQMSTPKSERHITHHTLKVIPSQRSCHVISHNDVTSSNKVIVHDSNLTHMSQHSKTKNQQKTRLNINNTTSLHYFFARLKPHRLMFFVPRSEVYFSRRK